MDNNEQVHNNFFEPLVSVIREKLDDIDGASFDDSIEINVRFGRSKNESHLQCLVSERIDYLNFMFFPLRVSMTETGSLCIKSKIREIVSFLEEEEKNNGN